MHLFWSTATYEHMSAQTSKIPITFLFCNFLKQIFIFLKPCKETKYKKVLEFVYCLHAMSVTRPSLCFCWLIEGTVGRLLAAGSW